MKNLFKILILSLPIFLFGCNTPLPLKKDVQNKIEVIKSNHEELKQNDLDIIKLVENTRKLECGLDLTKITNGNGVQVGVQIKENIENIKIQAEENIQKYKELEKEQESLNYVIAVQSKKIEDIKNEDKNHFRNIMYTIYALSIVSIIAGIFILIYSGGSLTKLGMALVVTGIVVSSIVYFLQLYAWLIGLVALAILLVYAIYEIYLHKNQIIKIFDRSGTGV